MSRTYGRPSGHKTSNMVSAMMNSPLPELQKKRDTSARRFRQSRETRPTQVTSMDQLELESSSIEQILTTSSNTPSDDDTISRQDSHDHMVNNFVVMQDQEINETEAFLPLKIIRKPGTNNNVHKTEEMPRTKRHGSKLGGLPQALRNQLHKTLSIQVKLKLKPVAYATYQNTPRQRIERDDRVLSEPSQDRNTFQTIQLDDVQASRGCRSPNLVSYDTNPSRLV